MGKWQIWIDRGGTFTDLVARNPDGNLVTHKLLSENPEHYPDAAIQGIRDLLRIDRTTPIPSNLIEHIKMGTTVATNALLERKGDRTAFVTTKGFGDALRIGYQNRPRLFDLHIVLPELLYEKVLEVAERIDVNGNLLTPLDTEAIRSELTRIYELGIRSVAIAFMHGYRFPDHEIQVGRICEELGFTQISLSHQASPLIKLVARGDTTVVDAYLSPILRRYVEQVVNELDTSKGAGPNLMFMQSNGGLTDAQLFQGKDAILSGPAGGVVGMAKTAAMNDIQNVIGFDMGGTSTDVAQYNGEYERSFETMVAGVRLRAPMMHIHTVAAGGGSVLSFDGARLRVGPESAGANPGPACYRRGGPLAVTDCNVLLGKIQPEFFPSIFGESGQESLDLDIVRDKFTQLADEVSAAQNRPISSEEVAEGFLKIAVENMAGAIKKISIERGHDVTQYALNCFGGAGGQHACLVADALGMEQILLHPLGGVLSAYGMGLAEVRAAQERQLGFPLTVDNTKNKLTPAFAELTKTLMDEVHDQGINHGAIAVAAKVHVRVDGTDTNLLVAYDTNTDAIEAEFNQQHQQRFGFVPQNQSLIAEAISVEAIGTTEADDDEVIHTQTEGENPKPVTEASIYMQGEWRTTPLIQIESLQIGQLVKGPAILIEPTGTLVIEPGWQGLLNERRHLMLTRHIPRATTVAIGTSVDPIMLEVFNNLFMSIAEQMGVTLQNTAHSVNIKERLDFSCAIFDAEGNLVANAPHVPVHLGSMGESVKAVMLANADKMKPGDAFALNSPYHGGTHLPDVTVITPIFDEAGDDILFYVGSRGHHADIGGRTPGSAPPDSTHIEQEGVLINNLLLVRESEFQEQELRELLASGPFPCRNIDQNVADLSAQIAANETGRAELLKMVSHYGIDVVQAYMHHVQQNAEESVRRVIDVLKDSDFTYAMDDGRKIQVSIRVDHKKRCATIDFSGTSDQDPGNYNAPIAVSRAAVLYVFRTLVNDDIPLNEGCMQPLDLVIPEGSMLDPHYPAAVMSGNTELSQAITNALYGALGILAASQGTMNNFIYGNESFQNYETICGGTGAGSDHNGTSAVHSHMTNTRMTDPEVLELRYPVINEEFSIRSDSGGQGKYSGGDGVIRQLRFLEPVTVTMLTSHREVAPFGVDGGSAGKPGLNFITHGDGSMTTLNANDEAELQIGDAITLETPGGGGFGTPKS